jgi:hypothetical protein
MDKNNGNSIEERVGKAKLKTLLRGRFTPLEDAKAGLILSKKRKQAMRKHQFNNVDEFAKKKAELHQKERLQRIKTRMEARRIRKLTVARAKAERRAMNITHPRSFGQSLGLSAPTSKPDFGAGLGVSRRKKKKVKRRVSTGGGSSIIDTSALDFGF